MHTLTLLVTLLGTRVLAEGPGTWQEYPFPAAAAPSDECPPCFNCMLPLFPCLNGGACNEYSGICDCPVGFGANDCSEPVCGSLATDHRPPRKPEESCQCDDGWSGINCNMCGSDSSCDAFLPGGLPGTCYKGGILVEQNNQMCDITNRKIIDILKPDVPQVTFGCNSTSQVCDLQFWIAEVESFYCHFTECDFDYSFSDSKNSTNYKCDKITCECIPGRMLCGKKGSINIDDFLSNEIKGPGHFQCDVTSKDCVFSEPAMNNLISSVFGDDSISLKCDSSECLHYTQLPGYIPPVKKTLATWKSLTIIGGFILLLGGLASVLFTTFINKNPFFDNNKGSIRLPNDNEDSKLMTNHIPVTLSFNNISYQHPSASQKKLLSNVFGLVKPGEIMAIMGGSGAGKTTLLDILAHKNKIGNIFGSIYINGKRYHKSEYSKIIGFVDQDDYLFPTLTVYETVLNSALLRLPKSMSISSKKYRVLETLTELRILNIKDRLIGNEENRGISGGEKRRVAIACELVTSPSILFLDEPTSGLDSYNAFNVIESLCHLSKNFNRTIVFTIHQPRSNIVSLFDKLLLLADGKLIFSGKNDEMLDYLNGIGYKCPDGYNIADYIIDLTVKASSSAHFNDSDSYTNHHHNQGTTEEEEDEDIDNPPDNVHVPPDSSSSSSIVVDTNQWKHFAAHRDVFVPNQPRHRLISLDDDDDITLDKLVTCFEVSSIAQDLKKEIKGLKSVSSETTSTTQSYIEETDNLLPLELEGNNEEEIEEFTKEKLSGHSKAGIFGQISILSSRTFKNIYRNPQLLTAHYIIVIFLALFCGYLYFNISNDISGFQNRL